jgi:acetyl esterase/lipase
MTVTTETTELEAGGHVFGIRVYRPDHANGSALVWMHGGAFVFGTIDMPEADHVARSIAERGTTVVSVDYTLAPLDPLPVLGALSAGSGDMPEGMPAEIASTRARARFPVAVEQVVAAFDWAVARPDILPTGVSIGGASAGGNLAAGAAVRIRDRGGLQPASLLLAYPVLHETVPAADLDLLSALEELPPVARFPDELTRALNRNYAPDAGGDPSAFPGGHDQHGLPRTLIVNADVDRLRMSGERFAVELAAAGVDVVAVTEAGSGHGFLNEIGEPAADRSIDRFAQMLSPGPEQ